jgi:hypothetical protein
MSLETMSFENEHDADITINNNLLGLEYKLSQYL